MGTAAPWKIGLAILGFALLAAAPFAIRKALPHVYWQLKSDGPQHCVNSRYDPAISERQMTVCITDEGRKLFKRVGVRDGIVAMERFADKDPVFELKCHVPMHTIGHEHEQAGFKPGDIPTDLPEDVTWQSSCIAGFLHGYMQSLGGHASPATYVEVSNRTCTSMRRTIDVHGCYHALGHGLSRALDNRLVGASNHCARLPSEVRGECAAGAVMELELAILAKRPNSPYSDDPSLGPARVVRCNDVPESIRGSCLSREIHNTSTPPRKLTLQAVTQGSCEKAAGDARRTCWIGAGAHIGLERTMDQAKVIPATCGTLPAGDDRKACYYGAGFGFSFYQQRKPPRLWQMCESFSGVDKRQCFAGAGRGWALVSDKAQAACDTAPRAGMQSCKDGAALAATGLGLS